MWFKKKKEIERLKSVIETQAKYIEELKGMLPRAQVLNMMSFKTLRKLATNHYGIPDQGETKADVIRDIIREEKELKLLAKG